MKNKHPTKRDKDLSYKRAGEHRCEQSRAGPLTTRHRWQRSKHQGETKKKAGKLKQDVKHGVGVEGDKTIKIKQEARKQQMMTTESRSKNHQNLCNPHLHPITRMGFYRTSELPGLCFCFHYQKALHFFFFFFLINLKARGNHCV